MVMLYKFCSEVVLVVLEVSPGDEGASEEVEFGDEVRHAFIFIAANDHQLILWRQDIFKIFYFNTPLLCCTLFSLRESGERAECLITDLIGEFLSMN